MKQENKILRLAKMLVEQLEMLEELQNSTNKETVRALTDASYATARAVESAFVHFEDDGEKASKEIIPFL